MPDGSAFSTRPSIPSCHQIDASIAPMTPAELVRRFIYLNDEGDRLGEAGDRLGELAANDASFEAYEAVRHRPIESLEDAVAVLVIASNDLYEAVSARELRDEAAPAWASLGRVALFLAMKEGLDPAEYDTSSIHSGMSGMPARLRAGVWISRALQIGVRFLVSEQGEISLAFPAHTLENAHDVVELEAEYSKLDRKFLLDVLMSDIDNNVNQPYRRDTKEVRGREWLVSQARKGYSTMHVVEISTGAGA